ncbi:MAG: glycoside hydrolase family 13 protein [Clostridia bacterium]|nr:glycoside hydrolase family 13 protein [Clostridia bacterium]
MKCAERKGERNIYSCTFVPAHEGIFFYRFEVDYPSGDFHYIGRGELGNAVFGEFLPEWQLTVFSKNYVTPARSGADIIYHIFVDRFCKEGEMLTPRFGVSKKWKEEVTIIDPDGAYRANDYYGGNLKGIISKLDYLESLGVTIIYLSPIFMANSNHRYDTADYMSIEPMIGSEEDLKELIAKAKALGIGIMLDGVFNHSGSDSIYFNKHGHFDSVGAYQSKDSPYYNWYHFIDYPEVYESWWGITVVPTLNKTSKSLRKFLFGKGGVVEKWTSFGVSWRLDVVDELPIDFVDEMRTAIKMTNPDSIVLGEVWEDASHKYSYDILRPYFTKGQLDGVMNYPFKDAIISFSLKADTFAFIRDVMNIVENYPEQSLASCMTMLGSHDTERILNVLAETGGEHWRKDKQLRYRLGEENMLIAVKRLKIAAALEYTLPGIPSIYYGDEVGMQGFKDPINRRTFPWGEENAEILGYYKKLGNIRKNNPKALSGRISFANSDLLIMKRGSGDDALIIVANPTNCCAAFPNKTRMKELITDIIFEEEEIIIGAYGIMILQITEK